MRTSGKTLATRLTNMISVVIDLLFVILIWFVYDC